MCQTASTENPKPVTGGRSIALGEHLVWASEERSIVGQAYQLQKGSTQPGERGEWGGREGAGGGYSV